LNNQLTFIYIFICIAWNILLQISLIHHFVSRLISHGRRPRFCPPLLSNRCIETVAPHSSPPHAGGESCVEPEVTLSVVAACASLAGLPPPGPLINSHASSSMPATLSSPSFRLVVVVVVVSSLISSLFFPVMIKFYIIFFTHTLIDVVVGSCKDD
jgi:hypothetical protein